MAYKAKTKRLYEYVIVDFAGHGKEEIMKLLGEKYYIISSVTSDNLIHYILERVDYEYPEER